MGARTVEKMNLTLRIKCEMAETAAGLITKACFDTQAEAQQRVRVDTGAAKNSIHTALYGRNGYSSAVSAAKAANPKVKVLPQSHQARNRFEGYVAVGVEYGEPLEFRYPYMLPAFEKVSRQLKRAAKAMMRK